MAKEDFCFTYYDGDAARDKAHMSRLERGAYDDLISAQRKRGHLSLDDIKKVLSKDFENCWPSMEWILKKDDEGKFFIEWVDKSLEKMRRQSEVQKEKVNKYWKDKKKDTNHILRSNNSISLEEPIVNEDEDVNEDVNRSSSFEKYKKLLWTDAKKSFLNSTDGWLYQFCTEKKIEERILKKSMEEFITNIELQEDFKDLRGLRNHFLNWFNKKQSGLKIKKEINGSGKNFGKSTGAQELVEELRQIRG